MFWRVTFVTALLTAAAGVALLFTHEAGWRMLVGGVVYCLLTARLAWRADTRRVLRRLAAEVKALGAHTPLPPGELPEFDSPRRELEELGFTWQEDVRRGSGDVRLLCNAGGKIWAEITRSRRGRPYVSLYAFFIDGTVIRYSNRPGWFPEFSHPGAKLFIEGSGKRSVPQLLRGVKNEIEDQSMMLPEVFSLPALIPESTADFLRKRDAVEIRRRLAKIACPFCKADLVRWGIGEAETERLLELRRINGGEYNDYLPGTPTLSLVPAAEAVRSRIGGLPGLPSGVDWPLTREEHPMRFAARIDFAELPELSCVGLLPKRGMLYFFHAGDRDWRVLYSERPEREGEEFAPEMVEVNAPQPIAFRETETRVGNRRRGNQMFGYPASARRARMDLDCVKATAGRFPSAPEEWLLLLQVDEEEALYFWIHQGDLALRRFDRVHLFTERR